MLKIRLKPLGKKNNIVYKIVVMENLSARNGKSIDNIGFYDPYNKIINFNRVKLLQYISNGAYPTDTVRHLIRKYILQIKKDL